MKFEQVFLGIPQKFPLLYMVYYFSLTSTPMDYFTFMLEVNQYTVFQTSVSLIEGESDFMCLPLFRSMLDLMVRWSDYVF